ncbi:hypothetical protein ACLOJK_030830 [Asimina triloba]
MNEDHFLRYLGQPPFPSFARIPLSIYDFLLSTFSTVEGSVDARADGAFIPSADDFDVSNVTTLVKGVGEIGDVMFIGMQSEMNSLIGRRVVKVGRSSGLTTGTVMAYALEYNDEKGICFFTDFLVIGENQQTFDLEGDSGGLILLTGKEGERPRSIGIIWGGTANRGRLMLKSGQGPENWTSGVELGRLLHLLELDLITTSQGLQGLYLVVSVILLLNLSVCASGFPSYTGPNDWGLMCVLTLEGPKHQSSLPTIGNRPKRSILVYGWTMEIFVITAGWTTCA